MQSDKSHKNTCPLCSDDAQAKMREAAKYDAAHVLDMLVESYIESQRILSKIVGQHITPTGALGIYAHYAPILRTALADEFAEWQTPKPEPKEELNLN